MISQSHWLVGQTFSVNDQVVVLAFIEISRPLALCVVTGRIRAAEFKIDHSLDQPTNWAVDQKFIE